MNKVEVIFQKGYHRVEVTFREPFEYFFEIAMHVGKFKHPRDANKLAKRVREKFREIGLSKSLAFALSEDQWNYRSSAYSGRMERKNVEIVFEPSVEAINADRYQD